MGTALSSVALLLYTNKLLFNAVCRLNDKNNGLKTKLFSTSMKCIIGGGVMVGDTEVTEGILLRAN